MAVSVAPALAASSLPCARVEAGALLRLADPMVGTNLLQMVIAAVDVAFVAQLGSVDLAAATLATFLFNLLSYASLGLTGAAAPPRMARRAIARHGGRAAGTQAAQKRALLVLDQRSSSWHSLITETEYGEPTWVDHPAVAMGI